MAIKGDKPSFFKTFSYGNFFWVFSYFIMVAVFNSVLQEINFKSSFPAVVA